MQQQLGIAAVIMRSDGLMDWQRSPYSTLSEQEMQIPHGRVLLLGQRPQNVHLGHPQNIPTQEWYDPLLSTLEAFEQHRQTPPGFRRLASGNPYGQGLTPGTSGNPYGQGLTPTMSGNPHGQGPMPTMSGNPPGQGLTESDQRLMEWENEEEDHQPFYEGL